MSITTTYEDRDGYLYIKVEGSLDIHEGMESVQEWIGEARKRGYQRVLRDVSRVQSGDAKPSELLKIHQWGAALAESLRGHCRLAVLTAPGRPSSTEFFETVARNRGASMKFFTNLDEALEFLEVKKPSA